MATVTQHDNDALAALLVEATSVARLAGRLRDHIIARNIELPPELADWLVRLASDTAQLRDAVHDAGLDPSDRTASRRLQS
jgi:MoxR-like ATPase